METEQMTTITLEQWDNASLEQRDKWLRTDGFGLDDESLEQLVRRNRLRRIKRRHPVTFSEPAKDPRRAMAHPGWIRVRDQHALRIELADGRIADVYFSDPADMTTLAIDARRLR